MTKSMKAHRDIRIHNDLGEAVFYFKKRVEERIAGDDHAGVGLEIMAGLTLLAFAVEARFNFLGYTLIEGWDEWQSPKEKVKAICDHLRVVPDFEARPTSAQKGSDASVTLWRTASRNIGRWLPPPRNSR
jgi:hypothetical protein